MSLEDRHVLLTRVINKTYSQKEMKAAADQMKQLERVHSAFLKLASLKTWEEAEREYSPWTNEENLRPFCNLFSSNKGMMTIPATFSQFINVIIQFKLNKTKMTDWKKFTHAEKQITLDYQILQCDIVGNLSSVSHHAANFTLALADIPYGLS